MTGEKEVVKKWTKILAGYEKSTTFVVAKERWVSG